MENEHNSLKKPPHRHTHNYIIRNVIVNYLRKTNWEKPYRLQFKQHVKNADGKVIEPDISYWGIVKLYQGGKRIKIDNLLLVVEITDSSDDWRVSYERVLAAFNFKETMQEGFIYNYENGKWWRLRRANDGSIRMEEDKDYSSVLKLYLHTLVKE